MLEDNTSRVRRELEQLSIKGETFYESAADGLIWSSTLNSLSKAVSSYRSNQFHGRAMAKDHAAEFLAQVTPSQLRRIEWSLEVCRLIWITDRSQERRGGEGIRTGVWSFPNQPRRTIIEHAAEDAKRQWNDKEFTMTFKQLDGDKVEMKVYSLTRQARRENHTRVHRLQAAWDAQHDVEERPGQTREDPAGDNAEKNSRRPR